MCQGYPIVRPGEGEESAAVCGLVEDMATFALAIACFGIAAIPVMHVPWYPAAYFVAQRRLDVTIFGLAFLLLAGFVLLLTLGT